MQLTTRSPSSSSSRRNTPCVLGCCGPMLSRTVSPVNARSETRCFSSSTVISREVVAISFTGRPERWDSYDPPPLPPPPAWALIRAPGNFAGGGGEAEGYSFSTSLARVRLSLVDLVEIEGELDFFVAERMVLAQRVAEPIGRRSEER